MRAAYALSVGELVVDEAPFPSRGEDEAIVRVKACGICGSDVKFVMGLKKYRETSFGKGAPGFTGHEWAGEVVEVGDEVSGLKVGDFVVPYLIRSCGVCKFCSRGNETLCPEKKYVHGGFAEYVKVPIRNLMRLPLEMSFDDACLIEPLACCFHALEKLTIRSDDVVLVFGDGPMGLLNLLALKTYGVKVVVAGHHEHRLSLAEKLGADATVNTRFSNIDDVAKSFTHNYGPDIVVLAVNVIGLLDTALKIVSPGGQISVFAGAHPSYDATVSVNEVHYRQLTITGTADALKQHYIKAIKSISSGTTKPSRIISHFYPLDKIGDAFEMARKREAVKIVMKP